MGLTLIASIPKDAVHVELQDVRLPNGTLVQQFRQVVDGSTRVFERMQDRDGNVRLYVLSPEPERRR